MVTNYSNSNLYYSKQKQHQDLQKKKKKGEIKYKYIASLNIMFFILSKYYLGNGFQEITFLGSSHIQSLPSVLVICINSLLILVCVIFSDFFFFFWQASTVLKDTSMDILPLMLATYQRIAIQDADHNMGLVQALVSSLMVFIFLVQVVAVSITKRIYHRMGVSFHSHHHLKQISSG